MFLWILFFFIKTSPLKNDVAINLLQIMLNKMPLEALLNEFDEPNNKELDTKREQRRS